MNPRDRRGFVAVLVLLALLLSVAAFVSQTAKASNEITGLVSDCQTGLPVNLAAVTLTDASGLNPPQTLTTNASGTFVFAPNPSNYTLSATAPKHYGNGIGTPFRFDGSVNVPNKDICLVSQPGTGKVLNITVTGPAGNLGGAGITVYNNSNPTGKVQLVASATSNATTGKANASLWTPGIFEVRVYASGFQPSINAVDMSSTSSLNVAMTAGVQVAGWAHNPSGGFLNSGVTATLFNPTLPSTSGFKMLTATVTGSFYSFNVPPSSGPYWLVVDANGYNASAPQSVSIPGSGTVIRNVTLQPSPQEHYLTTVQFGRMNWSNLIVYRNLTLNPDSTIPGLGPAGLRNLRMQINFTLGTGQGTGGVSSQDSAAFSRWLLNNGPLYTTTDAFLLANGIAFNSTMTTYKVAVSPSLMSAGQKVWINTSATYRLRSSSTITYGLSKYFLNATLLPDSNTTVYHNETYIIELPQAYEMVSDTILPLQSPPAITTIGYTNITVDPNIVTGPTAQIRMIIEKATVGIARAKVIGPSGKFYVVNSAYQNYQAYVANNTNISFSAAETSNPPSNDSTRDNFTWRFLANGSSIPTPPNNVRYGIQPSFLFPLAGPYVVNLTAIGSGGNVSYRNITIWVDGSPPTPDFKTNVTGSGSAIGRSLEIDQGTIIKFDGVLSSDLAYAGKNGVIPNSGYAWDFNGDHLVDATGRNVTWTFNKPGSFDVTLNVTDAVGLRGVTNATISVTVNDTEAPVPGFTILDPTNEYAPISTLTELRNYTFNASKTTDNHDNLSAMNFTWTIPGPLIGSLSTNHTMWGMNITFGWAEWNLSYAVVLKVRDTGFGSHKPNTGTLTQNISVQIDAKLHPDLAIVVGSVKIDNANPESGQTITITMNVTNKASHGSANQVYVTVTESTGTQSTSLTPSWSLTDKNGNALSNLSSGSTATLKVSVTVVGQGNKTLSIRVADRNEPYTWVTSENTATESIVVNQPGWVNIAIIGSVVAVFAVVIFAMYYRRKVKAGDWEPRFRRGKGGKDEGGKEKPRKEKEPKEEKKRL